MGFSVDFYRTSGLKCPVGEFLDSLPGKTVQKITWVLKLIEEAQIVPQEYLKKLAPHDIWEVRVSFAGTKYRILAFVFKGSRLILTHIFVKKTQKAPRTEIDRALAYREDFLSNGGWER